MVKMILAGSVVVCSIVIVASFFQPWARAAVNVTKVATGLASSATGTLKNTPFAGKFIKGLDTATAVIGGLGDVEVKTQVSGYDIPTLINKKSSTIALSLAQIMFKDAEGLDKKSMLVYLLPLFALVCAGLAVLGLKNKLFIIGMGIMSGAISIGGLYNLLTINLKDLPIEVVIANGLWQTMYAYLLIFVLSVIWILRKD